MTTLTPIRYIPRPLPAPTPIASRRTRAKRGDGEKLRFEILDAVDQLLTKNKGDDPVSIRAVAELVGCTPPAIYLHFFDKQELLFEVCARRFQQLSDRIDAAVANNADPLESIAAGSRAYVDFGLEHPEYYRVLFMGRNVLTADQMEELRSSGVTGMDRLIERCQRAIDAGVVNTSDASLMAYGIWAIGHGVVSLMIAKPQIEWPDVHQLMDHLLDAHLAGLRIKPLPLSAIA